MVENRVDLHMHSIASDGTDSPKNLLEKMGAEGIHIFSLTDHDTVAGVEQLLRLPLNGIDFIPGIEFSCRMVSGMCHILGYGCDISHPSFQNALGQGTPKSKIR